MTADSLPAAETNFRDQRVGLTIFGVFQIVIGCFCGLMAPFMLLMVTLNSHIPPEQRLSVGMMIPAVSLYVLLAVAFISLGIGSILARRWAWSLTVVLSWLWLAIGAISMVFMLFSMPDFSSAVPNRAEIPDSALLAGRIIALVAMAVVYILLPGAFLLFYQRKSVWATCRRRDPKIRWTERCPLPVLALTVILGYSAICMPMSLLYRGVAPFFGLLLSGPAGAAALLASGIIMGFLAWGTYRVKMAAWWGTLLFWSFWGASAAITFSRTGLMTFYEKMELPPQQLEMIRKSGILEGHAMTAMMTGGFAIMLVFMLWVRRYFVTQANQADVEN